MADVGSTTSHPAPISEALPLQFAPFSSSISPSFWQKLTQIKLEILKLSNSPLSVAGTYTKGKTTIDRTTGKEIGLGAILELDANSFDSIEGSELLGGSPAFGAGQVSNIVPGVVRLSGFLRNYNTLEEFKNAPKSQLMESAGDRIMKQIDDDIDTGKGLENLQGPNKLNNFIMITFADLKKYKYYYWVGFPALLQKPAWEVSGGAGEGWNDISEVFNQTEINYIASSLQSKGANSSPNTSGYSIFSSRLAIQNDEKSDHSSASTELSSVQLPIVAFIDPSTHSKAPGWPIRNVLYNLSSHWSSYRKIQLVCWRDRVPQGEMESEPTRGSKSRVVTVTNPIRSKPLLGRRSGVVGWEKNDMGNLGPRLADLAPLMDPIRLADSAVDLNLQLMKWRIMPDLNLEKVKQTKVLLLGAGTLGCYVARTLMAWGVRKITLVDSSTVSFSNPVRQPLFEFEDSLGGGKPKAQAAAAALKRIYPGVDSAGITLAIPMPGHPIPPSNVEKAKAAVSQLEKLIAEHDVIYLLMDSRESRWLPTVIGASQKKLIMNVALGFDTYLIMRHGVSSPDAVREKRNDVVPGQPYTGKLGCYYCNDIVAPMDSLSDRTLDQMCTVTRPGVALIASSTAVELMVSILQHPMGILAPSDVPPSSSVPLDKDLRPRSPDPTVSSCLGSVPHQIRGFLAQFHNLKITGQAFDLCTGCSDTVVRAYEKDGFKMLKEAFEDAKYLERLTGLDKLALDSEALMESLDWEEDEDEEEV